MIKSPISYLLCLQLLCTDLPAYAITYIEHHITQNTTWGVQDNPVIINKSIAIEEGATLHLEAGVQVYFAHQTTLTVNGALVAVGNAHDPIVLTGWKNAAWEGIVLDKSGSDYNPETQKGTCLIHCILRGSGETPSILLRSLGCDVLIQSCLIENSFTGLQVERQTKLWLKESTIRTCHQAINICNTAIATIQNNHIAHCHSLLLGGTTVFEGNILKRFKYSGQHSGMIVWMIGGGEVVIRENLFSKFEHSAIKLYKTTRRSSIRIEENDFKHNGINLLVSCQYYNKGTVIIAQNNFYNYRKHQVAIYSPCYEATAPIVLSIGSNYWGHLSSRELHTATHDGLSDSTLPAVIHYAPILPYSTK